MMDEVSSFGGCGAAAALLSGSTSKPHLVSSMIKLSFWLFLCSGLTLIFGIIYFKNLHKEELLVERLKQTSDREIETLLRENDEERNDFKIKKVKKVGCKYNSASFRVYFDSVLV